MIDILEGTAPSLPRSNQIASLFNEAGLLEKYCSGIKPVRSLPSDLGAKEPVFEIMRNMFKVTLFPISAGGANSGVTEVFEYISENPGKRASELSLVLGISLRTVERYL